jgi:hypothetical protein
MSASPPASRSVAAVAAYDVLRADAKANLDRLLTAMPALSDRLRFEWRDDALRFTADWGGLRLAIGGADFELYMFDRYGVLCWDARFSSSFPTSLVALVMTKAVEASS